MPTLAPAMERCVSDFEIPRATDRRFWCQHPGHEGRGGNRRLEGRTRRVDTGDDLVGQWMAWIGREPLPHRRGQPAGKRFGVVARYGNQCQDLARYRIEQYARHTLFDAAPAGEKILHRHVEAGNHILARMAGDAGQLAYHPPKGVDLDLTCPGGAAQLGVLGLLDAAFADAKIRQLEQRIAIELGLGYRGDIADNM